MKDIKFEVLQKVVDTKFRFNDLKNINRLNSFSPPSVFIGSKLKYPLVNVGVLSPLEKEENAWLFDNEKYWADKNFKIWEVVKLRDGLLNSRFQAKVQDLRLNKRFIELAKEIAIASKPVEVEIKLKKNLNVGRQKDRVLTPHGMRATLEKAKITGNVKVDKKLDKIMDDEIKANKGMEILYKNNFDEYSLNKILSVGVLGLKKNKRLVPTRWSITATDDILGKQLINSVKKYKWIENWELSFGEFMGNCYLIMFFPGIWGYELFELYLPGSSWNSSREIKASTDYEFYSGRKTYASNTAGGYYATRLSILKYLANRKRQASVLVIRIETPGYWASLGVWVVRESVKKALKNKRLDFQDMRKFIETTKKIGMIKFGYDPSNILGKSKIFEKMQKQRSLEEWF